MMHARTSCWGRPVQNRLFGEQSITSVTDLMCKLWQVCLWAFRAQRSKPSALIPFYSGLAIEFFGTTLKQVILQGKATM